MHRDLRDDEHFLIRYRDHYRMSHPDPFVQSEIVHRHAFSEVHQEVSVIEEIVLIYCMIILSLLIKTIKRILISGT